MQVEQHPYSSRRERGASLTVAGGGDSSGAATVAEHEVRVGEGHHDERIGEDEEVEDEEGEEGEEEGGGGEAGEGEKDREEEGEDGDGEGQEDEEDDEDEDVDEEEEEEDDDDYDERASPSQQEEDEDAWEDVAYESLARNLGRRRRRYLISRSTQVLKGNLQRLGGLM